MIKQNSNIEYWTPDEVAECVEGINKEAYGKLWSLVEGGRFSEEPVVKKQNWWPKLPEEIQQHINECCEREWHD